MSPSYTTTYTTTTTGDPGAFMAVFLIMFAIVAALGIFSIVCLWRVFTKAGKPGWASIVPIYNTVILLEIAGKPLWWLLLLFIPGVNVAVLAILSVEIAQKFNKSALFGIFGLWLFSPIGYAILAFDSSQYNQGAAPATTILSDTNEPANAQVTPMEQPAQPIQATEQPVEPITAAPAVDLNQNPVQPMSANVVAEPTTPYAAPVAPAPSIDQPAEAPVTPTDQTPTPSV